MIIIVSYLHGVECQKMQLAWLVRWESFWVSDTIFDTSKMTQQGGKNERQTPLLPMGKESITFVLAGFTLKTQLTKSVRRNVFYSKECNAVDKVIIHVFRYFAVIKPRFLIKLKERVVTFNHKHWHDNT